MGFEGVQRGCEEFKGVAKSLQKFQDKISNRGFNRFTKAYQKISKMFVRWFRRAHKRVVRGLQWVFEQPLGSS